ncbi:MAG: RluA family pseudouridine synthase [Spirochaetes bacterium]|nr:RluA family pseudouridine synthase [Spirochaetota bacterium]
MKILYEDNHCLVVEKDAGMLSQGDNTGAVSLADLIKEYIKTTYGKPGDAFLGIVQRLDKPVSGVIIFAKTSKAARRINDQIRSRSIFKFYTALVDHCEGLPEGRWVDMDQHILKKRGYSEIVTGDHGAAKQVSLRVYRIASSEGRALLLVQLITGKKHQIRAQLSSMGMPVIGDRLYGSGVHCDGGAICLHSTVVSFLHPVSRDRITLASVLPGRFSEYMAVDPSINEVIGQIVNPLLPRGNDAADETDERCDE